METKTNSNNIDSNVLNSNSLINSSSSSIDINNNNNTPISTIKLFDWEKSLLTTWIDLGHSLTPSDLEFQALAATLVVIRQERGESTIGTTGSTIPRPFHIKAWYQKHNSEFLRTRQIARDHQKKKRNLVEMQETNHNSNINNNTNISLNCSSSSSSGSSSCLENKGIITKTGSGRTIILSYGNSRPPRSPENLVYLKERESFVQRANQFIDLLNQKKSLPVNILPEANLPEWKNRTYHTRGGNHKKGQKTAFSYIMRSVLADFYSKYSKYSIFQKYQDEDNDQDNNINKINYNDKKKQEFLKRREQKDKLLKQILIEINQKLNDLEINPNPSQIALVKYQQETVWFGAAIKSKDLTFSQLKLWWSKRKTALQQMWFPHEDVLDDHINKIWSQGISWPIFGVLIPHLLQDVSLFGSLQTSLNEQKELLETNSLCLRLWKVMDKDWNHCCKVSDLIRKPNQKHACEILYEYFDQQMILLTQTLLNLSSLKQESYTNNINNNNNYEIDNWIITMASHWLEISTQRVNKRIIDSDFIILFWKLIITNYPQWFNHWINLHCSNSSLSSSSVCLSSSFSSNIISKLLELSCLSLLRILLTENDLIEIENRCKTLYQASKETQTKSYTLDRLEEQWNEYYSEIGSKHSHKEQIKWCFSLLLLLNQDKLINILKVFLDAKTFNNISSLFSFFYSFLSKSIMENNNNILHNIIHSYQQKGQQQINESMSKITNEQFHKIEIDINNPFVENLEMIEDSNIILNNLNK